MFLKRVDLSVADKHLRAVRFLVLRFRQCRARPAKQRVGTVQRCLADGDAHAAAEVHKMTFAQKGTFKARPHPLRKERRFGERHRPRQCDGELSTPETGDQRAFRSEEHTSELQSLMRISYAVFCLKTKKHNQ